MHVKREYYPYFELFCVSTYTNVRQSRWRYGTCNTAAREYHTIDVLLGVWRQPYQCSLISEVSNLQGASICRVQSGYRDPHAASHAFLVEWETECRVSKAVREAGVFPLMLRGQCVDVSGAQVSSVRISGHAVCCE